MSRTVISVENLSKSYRLGVISTGTFYGDIKRWWALKRNKPDPYLKIGEADLRHLAGETIWALKDINFSVQEGEAVGIIGRNGAGKSTLLKILSQVTAPTSGLVKIKGHIASMLEVGTGFHPDLTGRENIYLNGTIMGMNRAEIGRKFDQIVDFSGVEQFIDTPVKRYSSGMYVRLAFAVAAHLEPDILIVDEVLAVGDAEFQKKCLGKMGDVAHEGRTVLFVSHNMTAIERLCKKAILLQKGIVEASGNVTEVITYYSSTVDKIRQSTSIKDRIDREGNGKARVIDIKMFNEKRQEISSIKMGQSFIVQLTTHGKLQRALIGILIGNSMRNQIIRGYTWEQVHQSINLEGNDVIECSFRDFPLMHGIYHIHTWLGENTPELCDYVENALTLTVTPTDVFGTGHLPDQTGGIAFVNADWKLNGKPVI